MKKSEIIEKLNEIEGDPEVYIKISSLGSTVPVDEIEKGLCENQGNDIYTFSHSEQRQAEEPDLEDCILLWTR